MTTRNKSQIAADRNHIVLVLSRDFGRFDSRGVDHLVANRWVRVNPDWRATDVAALVKAGKIEREVRREWDRQSGNRSLFGGAGVVQRHRAYVRLVVVPEVAPEVPVAPQEAPEARVGGYEHPGTNQPRPQPPTTSLQSLLRW